MDEQLTNQLIASAEKLAAAAASLESAVARLDAQHEALHAKVERIVAAIEEGHTPAGETAAADTEQLQARIAELEHANTELKAQAARLTRKTLPPLVSTLLSKSAGETAPALDPAALDKALGSLSLEQRIAVKAEMARAGMIE